MLAYHQAIMDFLKLEPIISQDNIRLLNERQNALGIVIPASIREWYSLEMGRRLLYGNGYWQNPIPLDELGQHPYDDSAMLVLMIENQAVNVWGVPLGDDDDPPVYFRYFEDNTEWELYADHFSTFIHIYNRDYDLIMLRNHPYTMNSILK